MQPSTAGDSYRRTWIMPREEQLAGLFTIDIEFPSEMRNHLHAVFAPVFAPPSDSPRLRCLTSDFPPGSFLRPDISYDGRRVLFAYCRYYEGLSDENNKLDKSNVPVDAFYTTVV